MVMAARTTTHLTLFISDIFGVNGCDICDMTSWIKDWLSIVLHDFIILKNKHLDSLEDINNQGKYAPCNGKLDGVFVVSIDSF